MFPPDIRESASRLIEALRAKSRKVTTAESCTGGLVSAAITSIAGSSDVFESGFVTDSAASLRRLPRYYAAFSHGSAFPRVACNAPWMSVVVEANGAVRPCFFHEPVGNVRRAPLGSIIEGNLRTFRSGLDVSSNEVCRRCVCSIRTGWRSAPWQ